MKLLPTTRIVGSDGFRMTVPKAWRSVTATCWSERLLGANADPSAHIARVDRVLDKLISVEHLMGIISFRARSLMALYEPIDAEATYVSGAWRATKRITYTEEQGKEYRMLEVFCEGLDQNMWYVRVSASVDSLDVKLANAIVESLRIEIPEVGRYGIPSR